MGRRTEEKVIGNNTYRVTQLDALKGRKALTRLAGLLGPALGAAAETEGKNVLAALDSWRALGRGVAALTSNLKEADVDYFCDLFSDFTVVCFPDGREPTLKGIFSEHFAGNYLEMLQWLTFCLEVNFNDFFTALRTTVRPASRPVTEQ